MKNGLMKEIVKNSMIGMWAAGYKVTDYQYGKLVDLMNETQKIIKATGEASFSSFENKVDGIMTKYKGHNFSESLVKAFLEDGRYEEVFPVLYGDLEKHHEYMKKLNEED